MKNFQTLFVFSILLFIFFRIANATTPSPKPSRLVLNEIQVSLFGQPCLLSGPVEKPTLQTIHTISPEQIPPGLSLEQLKKAVDKLKKVTSLPAALEPYREQMTLRLEAQIAFFIALENTKKSKKTDSLQDVIKKHGKTEVGQKAFEVALKKAAAKGDPNHWNSVVVDELTDQYHNAIQPDPEEDFHRVIRKMNIHYSCSFEEEE